MNFFGIGTMELLLILSIALIVIGPGKLPEMASALGKGIRKFRMATTELTRSLEREITEEIEGVRKGEVSASAPAEETGKAEEIVEAEEEEPEKPS